MSELQVLSFINFIDEIKANTKKIGKNKVGALSDIGLVYERFRIILGDSYGTYFWTKSTPTCWIGWIGGNIKLSPIIVRYYHARPGRLTFYHRKQNNKGSKNT